MVRYIEKGPTQINVLSYVGDNSTTGFLVTNGMTDNKVIVTENGVVQKPTADYTISGTTLSFTTAPASGVSIVIREMPV